MNWSANESKIIFVVRPITIGKGSGGVAQESEGRRAERDDLGESVWRLADTVGRSVKTEVCD